MLTEAQIRHWLSGFAKADEKRERAFKFVCNNMERVLSLFTSGSDSSAEDRLHDLRIDWYAQGNGDAEDAT